MKKANVILLTVLFLTAINAGYAGTVAAPYQVGTWSGFKTAVITWTFDDGCANQFSTALPMFNSFGFKMTFYPVPAWTPPWSSLQTAASQGHEVGSHTVDHFLSGLSDPCQIWELSQSQAIVNSHIPGNQCVTIAYPNCNIGNQSLIDDYYIAGRTCDYGLMPATPSNFYTIGCHLLGPCCGNNTLASITSKIDAAGTSGGWCVFLIHDLDNGSGFSPLSSTILLQSLQYLDARRSTYWVSTFSNVVRYIKERNDVSVAETSNTDDSITLQVTDTLNNAIYKYPITIRRPLPEGWGSANVSQNAQAVPSSIVKVNSTAYVMFDVVPDGGEVVLSRGIYGDFTDNGVVDLNDLSGFLKFWLVNDCDGIAGLDVDEDCVVNFNEFAVLAENWQQAP